jgi:predicted 3-demethylubiquinone-9 3-methyltransferase (glyoxalase superfamily)
MAQGKKKRITPFFWFDGVAEEAANYYTAVFSKARIKEIVRYGKEGYDIHRQAAGSVMTVRFELEGQEFVGLNGGPVFRFTPAISFFVVCESEAELHLLHSHLLQEGDTIMPLDKYDWSEKYCWIQDRYGLSWQLSLGRVEDVGQKITPCLLFVGNRVGQAEKAMHRYTEIFENSIIDGILYYGSGEEQPEGLVKHAQFGLDGYKFMVMESGLEHSFTFSEAQSFVVHCNNQQEIDYYWKQLSEGADKSSQQCGWLKDRFGISWQVVPAQLPEMLNDADPAKASRVFAALLEMIKIDIDLLKKAYEH